MSDLYSLAMQRRLVERLREPFRYPHPVRAISVVETHISFVLLTGDVAYKIKKAVDLGFLDYTGLRSRRVFCEEEWRLNRRLAPELYRAVVPIYGSADDPRFEPAGEPIEFAVQMAEFAQENLLDRVFERGELTPAQIDAVAATLVRFHASLPPADRQSRYGGNDSVWIPVAVTYSLLRSLARRERLSQIEGLERWCRAEFESNQELLEQRRRKGFVRECHGDLHLANIALFGGQPHIFDCIEFKADLRWIDILSDVAFLAMDLGARGREDYAWRLMNRWLEGVGDYAGLPLLRFYQVYRAAVRAMVAAMRGSAEGRSPAEKEEAARLSAMYLVHGQTLIAPRAPALLMTCGLSGSGKSTFARQVAEGLGAVILRSDVERKRLYAALGAGRAEPELYDDRMTERTYRRLAELAAGVIGAAYPVIVDAASLRRWQRDLLRDAARRLGVPFIILHCRAPLAEMERRVARRARAGGDASDADLAVLARQSQRMEAFAGDEQGTVVDIDTLEDDLSAAVARVQQRITGEQ